MNTEPEVTRNFAGFVGGFLTGSRNVEFSADEKYQTVAYPHFLNWGHCIPQLSRALALAPSAVNIASLTSLIRF